MTDIAVSADVVYIKDGELPVFRVTVVPHLPQFADTSFEAVVDIVTSWEDNEHYKPPTHSAAEFEPYLRCTIKWDSCSHFWFGQTEKDAPHKRDGYLHLCGVLDFQRHVLLMKELYDLAFKRMNRSPEPDEVWT
jgi:hypothetical protein